MIDKLKVRTKAYNRLKFQNPSRQVLPILAILVVFALMSNALAQPIVTQSNNTNSCALVAGGGDIRWSDVLVGQLRYNFNSTPSLWVENGVTINMNYYDQTHQAGNRPLIDYNGGNVGGDNGVMNFWQDAQTEGNYLQVVMEYEQPLVGLMPTSSDIDWNNRNNNRYRDVIFYQAFLNNIPVEPTEVIYGDTTRVAIAASNNNLESACQVDGNDAGIQASFTAPCFYGIANNSPNTRPNGNARAIYNSPVDKIIVTYVSGDYWDGDDSDNPTMQYATLGDFCWTGHAELVVTKTQTGGENPVTRPGTLDYQISVDNTGDIPLTGITPVDILPDGSNGILVGPMGDTDNDNALDINEIWTYSVSYDVTAADIAAGVNLVNTASVTSSEIATPRTDTASTPIVVPPSGDISGSVREPNSNPISGVTVVIRNPATGLIVNDLNGNPLTTVTLLDGSYSFSGVPLGDYEIVETDPANYVSISDGDSSPDGDTNPNAEQEDNKIPVTIVAGKNDVDNNFVDAQITNNSATSCQVPPAMPDNQIELKFGNVDIAGYVIVGDVRIYENVAIINGQQVDARLTVLEIGSDGQNVAQTLNIENNGLLKIEQKAGGLWGHLYGKVKIDFIDHLTLNPIPLNFQMQVADIDLEGRKEYVDFYDDYASTLVTPTTNLLEVSLADGVEFRGTQVSDETMADNAASVVYNNQSTITLKIGQKNAKARAGFYLQVDEASFILPFCNGYDFGDAIGAGYSTTTAAGAAATRHKVVDGLYLGSNVDVDNGQQENVTATADDDNGIVDPATRDDEDGVAVFTQLSTTDTSYSIDVLTTNMTGAASANLLGWIDFDANGIFDADEASALSTVANGSNNTITTLSWPNIPAGTVQGDTYLRLRYTQDALVSIDATGTKDSGEVEDYVINIAQLSADLSITKVANETGPEIGETVTYTIVVTNNGPVDATGVSVSDTLAAGLSFVSATGCNAPSTGDPVCGLGDIANAATKSYTVTADVLDTGAAGAGDDYNDIRTNTVTVSGDQPDPDTTNNNASEDVTVSGLELSKLVCNFTAHAGNCNYPADFVENTVGEPGDILEYRIAYTRYGIPAFDTVLSDAIPSDTDLELNTYVGNTEISFVCPNAANVFVETGAVVNLNIDIANECVLNTATRADGNTVSEALIQNESGYFLFRVKIK